VGSGLIYAVIVALWAVVLVPMWLRRHDDVAEVRQVDRFSKAMRILSRRGETSDSLTDDGYTGEVITPESRTESAVADHRSADAVPTPPLASINLGPRRRAVETEEPAAQVFVSRPRSAQRRHEQASRRRNRQRVLLGLLGLVLLTSGLTGFGLVGLWLPGAALLLSAGYLVLLRRHALADQQVERELARQIGRTPTSVVDVSDTAAPVESVTSKDDTVQVVHADRAAVIDVVATEPAVAEEVAWRPSSPPLPTYVTAPAATRVPRVIDREGIGGLTAERMVELAEAARTAPGIDATPADDEVWSTATAEPAVADRDAVFDREWFETDIERDGFAEAVDDEVERIVGERPRRRHPSHDQYDDRRAFGA
jgi:hypothetical protein